MNGSESGRLFESSMTPVTSQPPVNNVRVGYTPGVTSSYSDVMFSSGGGGGGSGGASFHHNININEHGGGESMMKKRGRPAKYHPEGSMSPSPVTTARPAKLTPVGVTVSASLNGSFEQQQPQSAPPISAVPPPISAAPVSSIPLDEGFPSQKKVRGRPRGSSNRKKERESLGTQNFSLLQFLCKSFLVQLGLQSHCLINSKTDIFIFRSKVSSTIKSNLNS